MQNVLWRKLRISRLNVCRCGRPMSMSGDLTLSTNSEINGAFVVMENESWAALGMAKIVDSTQNCSVIFADQ